MWLAVRGQRPFHGPNPGAFAAVTLLANGAAATVAQARAEWGVGGLSALRRRIHFLSLIAGLAGCSPWKAHCSGPAPAGP